MLLFGRVLLNTCLACPELSAAMTCDYCAAGQCHEASVWYRLCKV